MSKLLIAEESRQHLSDSRPTARQLAHIHGRMVGWLDEWIDGWMDVWMERWDGCMRSTHIYIHRSIFNLVERKCAYFANSYNKLANLYVYVCIYVHVFACVFMCA